jgi:hypothetical protein
MNTHNFKRVEGRTYSVCTCLRCFKENASRERRGPVRMFHLRLPIG